jgi:hypothetical protein
MKKYFVILLLFILLIIIITQIPFVEKTNSSGIISDVSCSMKTPYETILSPRYNFFSGFGLKEFPVQVDGRPVQRIGFDPMVYDFYADSEISGIQVTDSDDQEITFIMVQSPKLQWHNPENCYIFSDWIIREKYVDSVIIHELDSIIPNQKRIYFNQLVIEKEGVQYLVGYWYLFKDRNKYEDIVLLNVRTPLSGNKDSVIAKEKSFIQKIFSESDFSDDILLTENFTPSQYTINTVCGEDNPPQIPEWLVIGPWTSPSPRFYTYPPKDWDTNWLVTDYPNVYPAEGEILGGKRWRMYNGSYGIIKLDSLYPGRNSSYAYAASYIYSNDTRTEILNVCSDDGVRVWVNGDLVHSRVRVDLNQTLMRDSLIPRGSSLEDTVPVTLRQGWNVLILELFQWKGSWEYSAQFRRSNGELDKNLVYDTTKPGSIKDSLVREFQIGYEDGSADEFSSEWYVPQDYFVGESFKEFPRAVSSKDPVTRIHFFLENNSQEKEYDLFLKSNFIHYTKTGFMTINISVNGIFLDHYTCPDDCHEKRMKIPKNTLKEGLNTISLNLTSGGDYIVWDYVTLYKNRY